MDQRHIAYKPLELMPVDGAGEEARNLKKFEAGQEMTDEDEKAGDDDDEDDDDDNDDVDVDDDDNDGDDEILFSRLSTSSPGGGRRKKAGPGAASEQKQPIGRAIRSLRNLRTSLCIVALLLFLVLMFQTRSSPIVTTTTSSESAEPSALVDLRPPLNPSETIVEFSKKLMLGGQPRPQYSNYLASVVRNPAHLAGDPLDDLEAGSGSQSSPRGAWWTIGTRLNGSYVTVANYIRATKSFDANQSITLSTQATIEFIYHALELCVRWDGPISLAVFCPGDELPVAVTLIKYMRHCLPAPLSGCIKDKVTWHLAYNRAHGRPADDLGPPQSHLDRQNFALFAEQSQCPKFNGPKPSDLIQQFESELGKRHGLETKSYRQQFKLVYPINVLRNLARESATTHWIMASDIELYPSVGLVPSFMLMLKKRPIANQKYVFTLPIFEVEANATVPRTKPDLLELIARGDAIFFHKWVCDECQSFPNRLDWLEADILGQRMHQPSAEDGLVIFEETQRNKSLSSWEPIFIGTLDAPPYDDRLTWEGRRDKMGQMYEMCLQGYKLLVLGNAFLVHTPGIKHIDRHEVRQRSDYIRKNNAIYDATMAKLKIQYAGSKNINTC